MQIDPAFKDAIKNTFYDKTVTKYSTIDTKSSEGWSRRAGTTVTTGTFLANVQYDNFEKVQKMHGIDEKIDVTMTTDELIEAHQIVGYGGQQYDIFKVIQNDSHYLLVGREWSSKSSTSISA